MTIRSKVRFRMKNNHIVKDAFILSAGLGKRLLPYTKYNPKPLVPINEKPMIEYILDALFDIRIRNIYINTYYLSDQIEKYFQTKGLTNVHIKMESELLDTGGGVKSGLGEEYSDPIFIINCDALVLQNYSRLLSELRDNFIPSDMDAILALSKVSDAIGYSGSGDFYLGKNNILESEKKITSKYVFMGISILNPIALKLTDKKKFSLIEIWKKLIFDKKCYGRMYYDKWCHTGSSQSLDYADKFFREQNL